MARPNVKFTIIDESLVTPVTEDFSTTIAGVWNTSLSLRVLGTTAEKEVGYYFVPNSADWYGRLTDLITTQSGGLDALSGITAYTVGSCAASYLDGTYSGAGISAQFDEEWWPINNYLQYGGGCYVGWGSSATVSDSFRDLGYDVVFQGGKCGAVASPYATAVTNIVEYRSSGDAPVIGVVYAASSTDPITTGVTFPSGTNTRNYIRVYGEKLHLDSAGMETIETPLAADVAGCLVRTDRDAFPWFSPAGEKRGRILNVLRLKRNLSTTEQDILYSDSVRANPVVTFPGSGTLLFGDKTGESATSTFSRINVSRLFMYLKKALSPIARSILFEQNDAVTRSRFKIAAEGFLDRIVAQRGISQYKIICDETNNTPDIIEANYFVADVLVKPITSINYVTITLTNKDLSSTF